MPYSVLHTDTHIRTQTHIGINTHTHTQPYACTHIYGHTHNTLRTHTVYGVLHSVHLHFPYSLALFFFSSPYILMRM